MCRWDGEGTGNGNAPAIDIPSWWEPNRGNGNAPVIGIPEVGDWNFDRRIASCIKLKFVYFQWWDEPPTGESFRKDNSYEPARHQGNEIENDDDSYSDEYYDDDEEEQSNEYVLGRRINHPKSACIDLIEYSLTRSPKDVDAETKAPVAEQPQQQAEENETHTVDDQGQNWWQ